MVAKNPNQNPQDSSAEDNTEELDQSEALKRAVLKLQQSGKLSHVPDDLVEALAQSEIAKTDTETSSPSEDDAKPVAPDDQTIATRPKAESPTVASTSDDIEHLADERAQWAAVMTGWDDFVPRSDTNPRDTITSTGPDSEENKDEKPVSNAEQTIPSRQTLADGWELSEETPSGSQPEQTTDGITLVRKEIIPSSEDALTAGRGETPWALQQFFDGEINLEQELMKRFPRVPAMTDFKTRTLGTNSGREVATLSTQDGSASLIVDADMVTKEIQLSFMLGSMMSLRYTIKNLSPENRNRWLGLMRRDTGGLAFLWNEARFREDYLICVTRPYSTNIFAFSPRNFESAVRITKDVTTNLLDWLERIWNTDIDDDSNDDDEAPLLTW